MTRQFFAWLNHLWMAVLHGSARRNDIVPLIDEKNYITWEKIITRGCMIRHTPTRDDFVSRDRDSRKNSSLVDVWLRHTSTRERILSLVTVIFFINSWNNIISPGWSMQKSKILIWVITEPAVVTFPFQMKAVVKSYNIDPFHHG